jgi:hypothetical protein
MPSFRSLRKDERPDATFIIGVLSEKAGPFKMLLKNQLIFQIGASCFIRSMHSCKNPNVGARCLLCTRMYKELSPTGTHPSL